MWRYVFVVVFSLVSIRAVAESPSLGPTLEQYGPAFGVEGLAVPVDKDAVFRAVFDAATYRDGVTGINTELESVARFINMHARHGVPLRNMDLAVVLHGEALKSALTHEAYRKRFSVENPNLDLLLQLSEAGVDFYACGQSLGFRGFDPEELAGPVEVALSAMTMLTVLQSEGYALLP